MRPPFHIPLTTREKALIGEVCALQGQVEEAMQDCVQSILGLSLKATLTIMGSNSLRVNASIWMHIVREKGPQADDVKWALEQASAIFEAHTTERNDFVHAVFSQVATHTDDDGERFQTIIKTTGGPLRIVDDANKVSTLPAIAIRTSSRKHSPVSRLTQTRNRAMRLAHLTDFIREASSPGLYAPSLSRRGLGPLPRFPKRRSRLETEFGVPPRSSRASPRKKPAPKDG